MINELNILLRNEKYDEVIKKCKELLQEDSNNSLLWYMLFLAENKNYIHTDFDNIKDEMAFNQALDLANRREKAKYLTEYNLYKNFSCIKYMRELFRYAQNEDIKNFIKTFELVNENKEQLIVDDKEEFYSSLDYLMLEANSDLMVDLNLLALNLLIIKIDDEECNNIFNELVKTAEKMNTVLSLYDKCLNLQQIKGKLNYLFNNYQNEKENEKIINPSLKNKIFLATNLVEKKDYLQAKNIIDEILIEDKTLTEVYLLLLLIDLKLTKVEQLYNASIDYQENSNFKKALYYANKKEKLKLLNYAEVNNQNLENINKEEVYLKAKEAKKKKDYENAIYLFLSLNNYADSYSLLEECKEEVYKLAINKKNKSLYEEAFKLFELIIEYKDSNSLFKECKSLDESQKIYQQANIDLSKVKKKELKDKIQESVNLFNQILSYKDAEKKKIYFEKYLKRKKRKKVITLMAILTPIFAILVLFAYFQIENYIHLNYYTISFITNGGNELENVNFNEYRKNIQSYVPVKDNRTFDGWYTDKYFQHPFDVTNTDSMHGYYENGLTLYAKYKEEASYINFECSEIVAINSFALKDGEYTIPDYFGGEKITKINNNAFNENMSNSYELLIPETIEIIEKGALVSFENRLIIYCSSDERPQGFDEKFSVYGNGSVYDSIVYWGVKDLVSDENFKYIILDGNMAKTLKYIGNEEVVEIPSSIEYNNIKHTVIAIGQHTFNSNNTIKEVKIPDSIEAIEDYSFAYCGNLESINLNNTIESIGVLAFADDDNLTTIIIPTNVTTIKDEAFAYCDNLTINTYFLEKPDTWSEFFDVLAYEGGTIIRHIINYGYNQ